MAESFITQCPHCGTSFRVRDEQLSVANGSVRCGACLQVFSARNHVVTTTVPAQSAGKAAPVAKRTATRPAPQAPKTTAKQPSTQPSASAKPVTKPISPAKPVAPTPSKEFDDKFLADDDDDAEFLFADGDDDFIFADGDDDTLFDSDEDEEDGLGDLSDSFLNINSQTAKPGTHFHAETQAMKEEELLDKSFTDDESWAESMLEEIEAEDTTSKPKPVASFTSAKPEVPKTRNAITSSPLFADFDLEEPEPQPKRNQKRTASQVVSQAAHDLDLEFHMGEKLTVLRPIGWIACVLLLIVFLAQIAWLQRDTYARMDQWRGLYQSACNILGCELPEQVDISQIRSTVIVRDHKNTNLSDIKIVDIVLTNRAPFRQPFPELVLQYSDVNGRIVADQSFSPSDYLKGELTGVNMMPVNTRIYVSVPIRTPRPEAVNYQLTLNTSQP